MKLKKIPFLLLSGIALLGTAGAVTWASSHINENSTKNAPDSVLSIPNKVTVAKIRKIAKGLAIKLSGITKAKRQSTLSFSVSGRIIKRNARIGDLVKKGAVIAEIDPQPFINAAAMHLAELEQIKAQLEQLTKNNQRMEQLKDANVVASQQLEEVAAAKTALSAGQVALETKLREARRVIKETKIRAPFSGIIINEFMELGEFAAPGVPVIELASIDAIELQVEVPEKHIQTLIPGQKIPVLFPFAKIQATGIIAQVASIASGSGHLFKTTISLPPTKGLLAGMTAEAVIETKNDSNLTVPIQAVVQQGASTPYVFVVRDNKAVKVEIALLRFTQDKVVVNGHLFYQEPVIVSNQNNIQDGEIVEVI